MVMKQMSIQDLLDLAHLRTALWFHGDQRLARLVTVDATQAQAARELGLPV